MTASERAKYILSAAERSIWAEVNGARPGDHPKMQPMGQDGLQVALDQVAALAGQWQGLGAQLAATTPPAPGPPFQPTTAAIGGINALVVAAAAALAARTQDTATGMGTGGTKYASQEATNATNLNLSNITGVTVV